MRRFYALPQNIADNQIIITDDQAQHITTVLRLQAGEKIIVCDGTGLEYTCSLLSVGKNCIAEILSSEMSKSEPKVSLTLFQGLPKGEKMDWIVQKCSELGIVNIVPVLTERCIVKLDDKEAQKKQERWQKIALEACKQCGRARVPQVSAPASFKVALKMLKEYELTLVAYEEEQTNAVGQALDNFQGEKLAYFIGPEGGIDEQEHKALIENGSKSVTLGRRILRTETAAITMGAILLYQLGEMNG